MLVVLGFFYIFQPKSAIKNSFACMLNSHMLLVTQSNYVFHRAKIYFLYHQIPYFSYGIQVLLAFIPSSISLMLSP